MPADFVVMEGRLLLHMEQIKKHINFSIYLDTDLDILLSRRIYRSLLEKQPLEEVIRRYRTFVKKNHEHFVEPVGSLVTTEQVKG
jgi:uridine kinase